MQDQEGAEEVKKDESRIAFKITEEQFEYWRLKDFKDSIKFEYD
jgi:hypothetical protein